MNGGIRKNIKGIIRRLPKLNFLLPLLLYINKPISRGLKRRIELGEAEKILRVCKRDDIKEIILIYDLFSSPPTYGDFFYTLMFARFFLMLKKKLYFWIIDSDLRQDALEAFSHTERTAFVKELLEISYSILNKGKIEEIKACPWSEAQISLKNYSLKTLYIPFEKFILHRRSIYIYSFNVLNNLIKQNPKIITDDFFLSLNDILPYIKIELPLTSYVTWHIRYSEKWGGDRNIKEIEFLNIYNSLKKKFPNYSIMVVSDTTGCHHFKHFARENSIDLLFSKDFSNSFIGDMALILNSKYFFALRGGGIASVPVFSKIPYGFIAKPVHETPFSKNKFAVWSTEKQVYINKDRYNPEDVLFCLKTID